jgi:glycerol-3-phosphate dehydrogenase (NAD(P)+)
VTLRVAILGGGAWGTALAIHLATRVRDRPAVTLSMRNADAARATIAARENARYLPNVPIPSEVTITSDHRVAADIVFVATPVAAFPAVRRALDAASLHAPLFTLAKGFVPAAGRAAPRGARPGMEGAGGCRVRTDVRDGGRAGTAHGARRRVDRPRGVP